MILTETSMSELTDMELDAVCGGFLNFTNSFNHLVQTNNAVQVGVAFGTGGGGNLQQWLRQSNFSII